VLVASGGAGTVSVIDPAALSVVASASVMRGYRPHQFGVSGDRSRVLVTATNADLSMGHEGLEGGSTLVYLIDVDARTMAQAITVFATAHNAAFLADDAAVVLSMAEHGMIQTYDAATFAEDWQLSEGIDPLEVTPTRDRSTLVVANSGGDNVGIVDVAAKTARALPVGAGPVGAWLGAGDAFYVTSEAGKSVSVLASDLASVAATIDVMGVPGQAFTTPDGRELWVAVEDRGVIAVFDTTTYARVTELSAGTEPHGIAFATTGDRAFVTDEAENLVHVIDVAAKEVTATIAVDAQPSGIVWLER
jgi:YVTN family beta-propeller protein